MGRPALVGRPARPNLGAAHTAEPTACTSSRHGICRIGAQRDDEMKGGATLWAVFSPDPAAIGLNDSTGDRQSEAGSMLLGRVEGLENLARLAVGDTRTAVDHCHLSRGLVEPCCAKNNSARFRWHVR